MVARQVDLTLCVIASIKKPMKTTFPALFVGFVSLSSFAGDAVDPRVLEAMRKEESVAQNFCYSFLRDNVRNGTTVAQDCLTFASARYAANFDLAGKGVQSEESGESVSRAHAEFCASVGEYAKPGGWVRGDCDAWNRARGELLALAANGGASAAVRSDKIASVATIRRRFCQSVSQSGNPGDASAFSARVSSCFALANAAAATDRAILLGDF